MGGEAVPLAQRETRWAALAGLVSVALIIGPAVAFFGGGFPEPGDTSAKVAALLHAHRTTYLLGIVCEAISLGVVLWFYAGLRSLLERVASTAARVMFASAIALSVLIWVEDSILAASARLAGRGADPEIVAGAREIGLLVAWPSARVATVVLLVAAAVGIFRTGVLPAVVAWFALATAIPNAVYIGSIFVDRGALAPASGAGEIFAPGLYYAWLFVAALTLALRSRTADTEAPVFDPSR
jgi:hypothetical protein